MFSVSVLMPFINIIMSCLMTAHRVQSLLNGCTKDNTCIAFISTGSQALVMAARDELTVGAGLICVEFDIWHWLRTIELWTSIGWERRGYTKWRQKWTRAWQGLKNYILWMAPTTAQGSICEITGAGLRFWGRRLRHQRYCGIVLKWPRRHFWREFTARVAIFPVGVIPQRQIKPCYGSASFQLWIHSIAVILPQSQTDLNLCDKLYTTIRYQSASEPPSVEADIYVWRYALLAVPTTKEEDKL